MSVGFHGSYPPEDVTFLLKPISMPLLPVSEKERRIQTGECHYSEMLSPEQPPSRRYLDLFHHAMQRGCGRFARHVSLLAKSIARQFSGPVTLVSLARAGTPVGVLLRRVLHENGHDVRHYSISIIRDRGIDENALLHIIGPEKRPQESIVFVDGWTGKGVIQRELDKAIAGFNERFGTKISPSLFVVADLCGAAHTAATCEDYLIPSSVLNATISGLVSRSVLNSEHTGPEDFHGCMYFNEFAEQDLSVWFADTVMKAMRLPSGENGDDEGAVPLREELAALRRTSADFIRKTMERYNVLTENYVKPGIGEATRVLLRRTPHLLLLRDHDDPDVRHLRLLAEEKNVPLSLDAGLPYKAAALIQNLRL